MTPVLASFAHGSRPGVAPDIVGMSSRSLLWCAAEVGEQDGEVAQVYDAVVVEVAGAGGDAVEEQRPRLRPPRSALCSHGQVAEAVAVQVAKRRRADEVIAIIQRTGETPMGVADLLLRMTFGTPWAQRVKHLSSQPIIRRRRWTRSWGRPPRDRPSGSPSKRTNSTSRLTAGDCLHEQQRIGRCQRFVGIVQPARVGLVEEAEYVGSQAAVLVE